MLDDKFEEEGEGEEEERTSLGRDNNFPVSSFCSLVIRNSVTLARERSVDVTSRGWLSADRRNSWARSERKPRVREICLYVDKVCPAPGNLENFDRHLLNAPSRFPRVSRRLVKFSLHEFSKRIRLNWGSVVWWNRVEKIDGRKQRHFYRDIGQWWRIIYGGLTWKMDCFRRRGQTW